MQKPDSLIFDMDGTLWDAVDTYAGSWNVVFKKLRYQQDDGAANTCWKRLAGTATKLCWLCSPNLTKTKRKEIYNDVNAIRLQLLPPENGSLLYDGVLDGLKATGLQISVVYFEQLRQRNYPVIY